MTYVQDIALKKDSRAIYGAKNGQTTKSNNRKSSATGR